MARILLIDDNREYLDMLKICLEKEGYEVVGARDTESWVTLYTQNHYDLVIVDLFMPQLDGVSAIRMMKAEQSAPNIIAMTGGSSLGTMEYLLNLAKEYGASEVYKKDTHINNLLEKIKSLL